MKLKGFKFNMGRIDSLNNIENSYILIKNNFKQENDFANHAVIQVGFVFFIFLIEFDYSHLNIISSICLYILFNLAFLFYRKIYAAYSVKKYLFTNVRMYIFLQALSILIILGLFLTIFYLRILDFPPQLYTQQRSLVIGYWLSVSIIISNWSTLSFLSNALLSIGSYNNKNISQKKLNQIIIKQQQINPHFLANALSKLHAMIRLGEHETALKFNSDLYQLFLNQLKFSDKEYLSIEEEIEYLKAYMEIENTNHNKKFEYAFSLNNADVVFRKIPPNLLQPIIENSINHGFVGEQNRAFKIEIFFTEIENGDLKIEIKDNGIGSNKAVAPKRFGHSIALENIKERISIINDLHKVKMNFQHTLHDRGSTTEIFIKGEY